MAVKNIKKYLAIDDYQGGMTEEVTPWAGVGLFLELFRRIEVGTAIEEVLPAKRSPKGLKHGEMVEAFCLLSALGGECIDDFGHLRPDEGLRAMLGYQLPAPPTARQWLDKAHEEELVLKAREAAQQMKLLSYIPAESTYTRGLNEGIRRVVKVYDQVMKPQCEVTLDVDAHLIESKKHSALMSYDGYPGFQPIIVTWAETSLVLRDEFRDGNVPAGKDIARVVDEAYAILPLREGGWKVRVRSDSAAYQTETLDHWNERGWEFAVSADMTEGLKEAVLAVAEEEWHLWKEKGGVIREWAEVGFVPSRKKEKKGMDVPIYRYVAMRIRKRQGELFNDGQSAKHFAVVSNRWDTDGQELLQWHRGKAGTVEHVHHILLNELGAGVYPSDKFGANAAWLKLQVLTHNLLELFKAAVLPEQYGKARPKKLRFAVFTLWGKVVRHAHKTVVRIITQAMEEMIRPARRLMRSIAWAGG
jgi:hypothetical protein